VVNELLICARCEKEIAPVSGRSRVYIIRGGKAYHVECVTGLGPVLCANCSKVLHPGNPEKPASHDICPRCVRDLYPEYADEVLEDDRFERAAAAVSGQWKG